MWNNNKKGKRIHRLKEGDKIYVFEYVFETFTSTSWEDRENEPWAYVGPIGERVVGCPYISTIREYEITHTEMRTNLPYFCIYYNNNCGRNIEKRDACESVVNQYPIYIKPEHGTGDIIGHYVICTSKEQAHIEWCNIFNKIQSALNYEKIAAEAWQTKFWRINDEMENKFKTLT